MKSLNELQQALKHGASFKYLFFWGHTARKGETVSAVCLSQWWPASFRVAGVSYATAEHWMMAEKARLFGDQAVLPKILNARTPAEAKKLGRQIAGFHTARWEKRRFEIVVAGNEHKFGQNPEIKEYLKNTGERILVEASPVDRIWGIGLAADHPNAADPLNWPGLNLLGFALMEVRAKLD